MSPVEFPAPPITPLGITTATITGPFPAGMASREHTLAQPSPFFDAAAGLWRVHSHQQVKQALLDVASFVPENALQAHLRMSQQALKVLARGGFSLPATIANNGGPTHAPIRAGLMQFFSPRRVKSFTGYAIGLIAARCAEFDADLVAVDLAPDFAWDIPARVMFELIGMAHDADTVGTPAVDIDTFKRWGQDSLELFWGWPDHDRQLQLAHSAVEFYDWLRAQVRTAVAERDGSLFDVMSRLKFEQDDGGRLRGPLTERELCALGYFLFIAGQETTCQLITTVLHHGLSSPRWPEFSDQRLATDLVLEVLRTDTPVHTWRRRVARPVRLGEVDLNPGDEVLLDLATSGSDGSFWDEPDQLVTGRRLIRSHQAFGTGVHRCVGAPLAELEAVLIVQALARQFPQARLDDPHPDWLNLLSFRAPKSARARLGTPSTERPANAG